MLNLGIIYLAEIHSVTFLQTEIIDDDKKLISAVDLYFIQDDGGRFRVSTMASRPPGAWVVCLSRHRREHVLHETLCKTWMPGFQG